MRMRPLSLSPPARTRETAQEFALAAALEGLKLACVKAQRALAEAVLGLQNCAGGDKPAPRLDSAAVRRAPPDLESPPPPRVPPPPRRPSLPPLMR